MADKKAKTKLNVTRFSPKGERSYTPAELKFANEEHVFEHGRTLKPGERSQIQKVENSPLTTAVRHLEKETQRGEHSPKVAGHDVAQHGGRVPSEALTEDSEHYSNLKGSPGNKAGQMVREHMKKGLPD